MDIYVEIFYISIFYLFLLVFKHGFIRCVDFTHIAASNTASDQVMTSQIRSHVEYLTHSYYIRVLTS